MTRRFSLPWWQITDGPELRTAPGGVYRAVIALSVAYWAGGCVGVPADDVTQAALARLPVGGWRQVKPAVSLALRTIMPRLDAEYAAVRTAWQRQADSAAAMRVTRQSRQIAASVPAPRLTVPATVLTSAGTAANSRRNRELARNAGPLASPGTPGTPGTSGKATFTD